MSWEKSKDMGELFLMDKLEIKRKCNDEGLEWFVGIRNGKEVYHCITKEMADRWMSVERLHHK
jgi:hypothetical protein